MKEKSSRSIEHQLDACNSGISGAHPTMSQNGKFPVESAPPPGGQKFENFSAQVKSIGNTKMRSHTKFQLKIS